MNNNISLKDAVYKNYFTKKVKKNNSSVHPEQFFWWAKLMHKRIKDWLPKNKNARILDLGTGTGNFLIMMDKLGYNNLTGVDVSSEQILIGKSLSTKINFVQDNILDYLENTKEKYDLIALIDVIEHFDKNDAFRLLNLANRALDNSGSLIIQTPNAISPWMGAVCFGDLTHEWFYTPNSLDDLLIQCGFNNYQTKEIAPLPMGINGLIRFTLWYIINFFYKIINSIEIGSSGNDQIYSRVFIATAVKKEINKSE